MQIFYAPGISSNVYTLDERESNHCIRVLRMVKGTPVKLIDGIGNLYEGIISRPDQKECEITINNVIREFEKKNYRLHIAVSPLKNHERFEWFIEKSVEIGIDEITPLISKNSEKQRIKPERIQNIIISAIKQSLKAEIPILHESCSFGDFIKSDFLCSKYIAHCNSGFTRERLVDVYHKNNNVVFLIGPEGDFTEQEISEAASAGYSGIHLGKSRLRTETAGIAACHSIYLLNQ